ncbi:MAG: NAD(P)H-dependent oxidoreductase [Bacteroidetes bacterium]|jgi:nitroreductase|nr:NAD(P)H-dependent oxidoreductase [Bacteroidota bacterium]
MKLLDALQWRYAVKKMNGTKIPTEKLDTIIEATRLAPSAFGLTPYTIIVVEDDETRKKLQPAFYNQSQVVDGSAVIIFAVWNTISEKEVAEYMQDIADQRGVPVDSLKDFSGYINGSLKNLTPEQARVWADKQAYIALGFSLVAAAAEQIDATPMEGFAPDAVDEVLGLKAMGLHSAVALTLGYRDAANDYLVNAKKVRRAHSKLIIKK